MHLSKLQNVFGQKQLSPLRSPYKVPVNHGGGNLLGQIILVTFCTCLNMKQITYIQNTTKAWILHFLIKDWIQRGPACAPNLTSFNHVVFSIVFHEHHGHIFMVASVEKTKAKCYQISSKSGQSYDLWLQLIEGGLGLAEMGYDATEYESYYKLAGMRYERYERYERYDNEGEYDFWWMYEYSWLGWDWVRCNAKSNQVGFRQKLTTGWNSISPGTVDTQIWLTLWNPDDTFTRINLGRSIERLPL